jgi:hypothetical protein
MLKRILFIILILLLSQVCFAGRLQEMQKAVIAAKNGATPEPPAGNSDTFTNTNGTALSTHSANWYGFGDKAIANVNIQSNTAQLTGDVTGGAYYSASTASISQITIKAATSSTARKFAYIRGISGTRYGYSSYLRDVGGTGNSFDYIMIWRNDEYAGSCEITPISSTVDHTLRVYMSDADTFRAVVDGTTICNYDDGSPLSDAGNPGFAIVANGETTVGNLSIDNWQDY